MSNLDLLNESFRGRVQLQLATVPGGDNHIAFAEAGRSLDWAQPEERAGMLAEQFPLDFSAILDSLREGAELRWAKARPNLNTKESHPCRKSTPT